MISIPKAQTISDVRTAKKYIPVAQTLDDARTIEASSAPQKLFTTFFLERGKGLPVDEKGNEVDLSGAIMITIDDDKRNLIHKIIYIFQVISSFLLNKQIDPAYCHTALITGKDSSTEEKDFFILADTDPGGIRLKAKNPFAETDFNRALIIKPNDPDLRALLIQLARQAVHVPKKLRSEEESAKKKAGFSFKDISTCWIRNPEQDRRKQRVIKRTSYVVADLLRGDQILNSKGKPHKFFCTAFATTLLQGTLLVQALNKGQRKEILVDSEGNKRSRDEVAKEIARILQGKKEHLLKYTYESNEVCRLNARYQMTCDAAKALQELGEPIAVTQQEAAPAA